MKIFYRNNIVSIILLVTLLSHITFMHSVVQNFVLCYGNDGHIQIEDVNDSESCESHSTFESEETTTVYINSADCEDVNLNENCFEEEQFISKNRIAINCDVLRSKNFSVRNENWKNNFNKNYQTKFGNNILESYTTVSLII